MNTQTAIALLQQARILIECGNQHHICYALGSALQDNSLPDVVETEDQLTDYILDNLGPGNVYFEEWLKRVMTSSGVNNTNPGLPHLARLAWVDRMIHQLQQDGTLP